MRLNSFKTFRIAFFADPRFASEQDRSNLNQLNSRRASEKQSLKRCFFVQIRFLVQESEAQKLKR